MNLNKEFKMQVQQQISLVSDDHFAGNHLKGSNPVTVEQIYDIDTISLEQLIEQFEAQAFFPVILKASYPIDFHNEKLAANFVGLTPKQLRKWYQLAKIQLQQRKKIEDYAMKLMEEQLESDQQFYSKNIPNFSNPFLKIKNSDQNNFAEDQPAKINTALQNKKQIRIELPPIKDPRSISRSKLPKIQQFSTQNVSQIQTKKSTQDSESCLNTLKRSSSKNHKSRKNLIAKILDHEKEQTTSKHCNQTLTKLRESSKTIQSQKTPGMDKKQNKALSKKEFLEMMKIKLNQGVDYKSGTFAKQPSKSSLEQNSSKIKKKDAQKDSRTKISVYMQSERAKTQTMHIGIKQKNERTDLSAIRKMNNSSTVSVNINNKCKQQIQNSRYRVNSTYTSRQTAKQKIKQKKMQPIEVNKMARSQSTVVNSKININLESQFQTIEISKTEQEKNQKLKIDDIQSNVQNKAQVIDDKKVSVECMRKDEIRQSQINSKEGNILNSINVTQRKKQIFIQNEDAYDDLPEILQKQIVLHKQELQQQDSSKSLIQQQNQPTHTQKSEILNENSILIATDTFETNSTYHISYFVQKDPQNISSVQEHQEQRNLSESAEGSTSTIQSDSAQLSNNSKIDARQAISSSNGPSKVIQQSIPIISKIRPISAKITPKYPPYHLQFPSFSHLFNIKLDSTASANKSKLSLPYLLKTLECSLEMYFQKNVSKIALEQMNNRMALISSQENVNSSPNQQTDFSQVNLQFKCISHLQFINTSEGKQLFDLDLTSFKQRSFTLLKKFKSDYLPYRSQLNQHKNHPKQKQNDHLFYRVVKNKPEVYDIINTSFYRAQNWLQLPHGMDLQGCWNLLWTWSKPQIDFNTLIKFQKVNHFPGSKELARKDLLKKNIEKIKKMSKKLNEYFDIIPETFFLPGQNIPFIKKFRESQRQGRNLWILKPVGLSRGRGISLINKLQQVVFSEPIVMQKYIHNPFLLDEYKFDLRIYVLVTSINPLECFIYKEGFARVSTERYCNDLQEIGNKFVHLTNYSIQKDSAKCPQMFTQKEKALGGCKLTLKMLRKRLQKNNISWDSIWTQIQQVVLKSLISCMKYIPQNANCFQLFGYDIMLDKNLKCWLIEVNSSPSLQKDFLIDQIVKQQLVDDIIEVVQPIQFDRSELLKVIKRRRKEFEGLKSHVNYSNNSYEQLNEDLYHILKGKTLRNYGEVKEHNNFMCIAPGAMYQKILKTVQHFTHDPFVKNNNFY